MNFNPEVSLLNMPELNWKYGYVTSVGIMVLVALVMVFYFKRKKWF
jgi:magnesium transporter